jgi:LacI family transcriptional regulator
MSNSEGAFKGAPRPGATLEDVARLAGVSPATVSRCLNRPDIVRPVLKAKVEAAIEALDYVPHGAARSLASRRSRMIGAIFPSLDSTLFGGALEALQNEVAGAGYTLVVASSNYDAGRERDHVRNMLASGIDALMLVGGARDPEVYRPIERKQLPYVLIWVTEAAGHHPCIGFDNAAAGMVVARHLLDIGHRRLAVISGRIAGNDRAAARVAGIGAALSARGLDLAPDHLIEAPFGEEEGREALRQLVYLTPRPTAVICGSEPFAYGALFEAQALGLRVPDDVSITGFDDMWLASHIAPGLTTLRTPRREMGQLAGRYLLSVLAGREPLPPRPLDFELIVRGSTAPPPAAP